MNFTGQVCGGDFILSSSCDKHSSSTETYGQNFHLFSRSIDCCYKAQFLARGQFYITVLHIWVFFRTCQNKWLEHTFAEDKEILLEGMLRVVAAAAEWSK